MSAPVFSPRTVRVAGDCFKIGKSWTGGAYALTVYSLSGKRIKEVIINKDIVDMRKDAEVSSGVYIVRVNALAKGNKF
jgi:hypothetical protein